MCCNQQEPTAEELVQLEQEEKDRQEVIDREKLAVIEDFPIEFQLASNCGLRSVQSSGLVIDKVYIDGPFELFRRGSIEKLLAKHFL